MGKLFGLILIVCGTLLATLVLLTESNYGTAGWMLDAIKFHLLETVDK